MRIFWLFITYTLSTLNQVNMAEENNNDVGGEEVEEEVFTVVQFCVF